MLTEEIHRTRRHVVSRAQSPEGGTVVVKAVRGEAADPVVVMRLRREYELLARLDLPGVVRAIAFRPVDGHPALIMQDAGAHNLKEWLHRREVPATTVLAISTQLAEALVRLHERGILHRDINPWNVVVDQHGNATLIDFEAATQVTTADGTHAGMPARLEGDLLYVAPEETGRMNRLVDQRADLYSLGVVIYEMLTGRPPFIGADPVELVHAHLARTPLPPAEAVPSVPGLLSDLVLRLLAKMPEARYQSAKALSADLREAQARLQRDGFIAPFELGLVDLAEELPLPDRLYQRDEERKALLAAWQKAAAGETRVLALAGAAGLGKSALTTELREPVARLNGHFLTAKFEELQERAPYAVFSQVLRGWAPVAVDAPAAEAAAWRRRIDSALGENAGVLTSLSPELARFLGMPPSPPAVGAQETENRLHLAFQAFLGVIASPEHPLLLFLDDWQWADVASVKLLEFLATADLPGLLIVTALRPEGCDAEHFVTKALARLAATPRFERIDLAPLTEESVFALCCDVLRADQRRTRELAALVHRKTAGNPFFVRRMLRYLQQAGLLVSNPDARTWSWDLGAVEEIEISENVVDLLLAVLRRLPPAAQEIVALAACFGTNVPLGPLAAVARIAPDEAAPSLWAAVRAGVLLPLDAREHPETTASFRFVHDRVRQAAYLLLDEEARKRTHLAIGRHLLAEARGGHNGEQALDEQIYAIVDQLDRGLELVVAPEERLRLSQLNARAARKARAASGYGPALDYVKYAVALLPEEAWHSHPHESFELYREAVQLAGFASDLPLAETFFQCALAHAGSAVDQADLYNLRMYASNALGAREEAFQYGLKALALLGIALPLSDPGPATAREIAAIGSNLRGRTPAELLEAPRMSAPEHLASINLLTNVSEVTYFHRTELWPFVAARMVNLSLEHGIARASAQAFGAYAVMLGGMTQDYATAHAFGRLSQELAARFGDPVLELKVTAMFACCVNNWTAPLHTTVPLTQSGLQLALKLGDSYFASASSLTEAIIRLHQGTELDELVTHLRAGIALQRTARYRQGIEEHVVFLQAIRTLQGTTSEQDGADAPEIELDENGLPAGLAAETGKLPEYQIVRLGVAYLMRDFPRAAELAAAVAGKLASVPRFVQHVELNFYSSLTLAARAGRAPAEARSDLLAAMSTNQEQLGLWAKNSPENYGHKHLLVAAELARLQGRVDEAAALYDDAITGAAKERFLQDEALGNELCGRFYLAQGRKRIAAHYIGAAVDGYTRWGATAKAEALEAELAEALPAGDRMRPAERRSSHDTSGGAALDLLALFRAAEAMSSEVMLPKLLDKLMEVCLATAGAERGAFVIEEEDQAFVRAVAAIRQASVFQRTPLETSPDLAASVVERVRGSKETLVIADASANEELAADPYIAAKGVRSLLALPILRQTKLTGVLYLENNLATRVFTPERIRLLVTLSSQIATSLQNSLLFEQLRQEVAERKRAEAAVRFISDAGATLAESLDFQSTLKKLARLAVPGLADWCVVHVVEDGAVRWVASAHVAPEKEALLEAHNQRDIGRPPARHLEEVSRSGAPILYQQVDRKLLGEYLADAEAHRMVAAIGAESSMVLPLRARDRFLGAVTLASSRPERRFDSSDLALAEELARRAAVAIDNARLYREANEAIRLRDEFLSIASHELNTPVASLKLVSKGLEAPDVPPSPATLKKVMNIIARQSQRLATLVSELLDVAQIPSGKFTLHTERVDLADVVGDVLELMHGDLERANCHLRVNTEPGLVGRWDRVRLQQVVANLLSNAVKFAAGTDVVVSVASGGNGRARLVVADRGIGIPPERLPHIFGRFERAVSARHYGGLGLGLYIVHTIVQAHGGSISAASVPGAGATFTVELPLGG